MNTLNKKVLASFLSIALLLSCSSAFSMEGSKNSGDGKGGAKIETKTETEKNEETKSDDDNDTDLEQSKVSNQGGEESDSSPKSPVEEPKTGGDDNSGKKSGGKKEENAKETGFFASLGSNKKWIGGSFVFGVGLYALYKLYCPKAKANQSK